jgi:basic membrane lipoprotein Med (substrate-binding protein (PBP1-ABC) superfamily)
MVSRLRRRGAPYLALILGLIALVVVSACSPATASAPPPGTGKGIQLKPGEKLKVGFLFVGPRDDFGYNQAADQGRQALEKNLSYVETIYQENVPENAEAERVMEQMIRQGAKIIFPTSYGHLDPALKVAEKHPEIIFLHQGGLKNTENVGTYFGEIWQPVFAGGVAAGKVTKSNKLGFVGAFPIPQLLLNVNAFELGAKSVNPSAITTVVFTQTWCDPAKLTEAANGLIDQGVDVITMHEDCTKPIVEAALKRGVNVVGYHADASSIAGDKWVTGAMWTWGQLYTDMVKQVVDGTWKSSIYRAGLKDNVVELAPFGKAVPADVQKLVTQTRDDIKAGTLYPFTGPIKDQSGTLRIKDGEKPPTPELEKTDWLVEGVIGNIPK